MAVEGIFVNGASGTLKKLVSVIASEISLVWGVKDELRKLKETLELIAAKTSDAETRQVNNAEVSLWLKRLKDAAYDADDLLDEFSYDMMHRSEIRSSKVKEFFSSSNQVVYRFKMAHKIKGINKQFNQIATDMKRFSFESITSGSTSRYDDHHTAEKRKRLTASFFGDDLKIVGREQDKSEIIKLLTSTISSSSSSPNPNQQEKVSVISIVGMGGLGKTTLAQSIYNSVKKHFIKRIWVCVSDEFDVYKILLNIMESCTNSKCPEFSNINVLVDKVKEELEDTLYLLVLDDLWNEDFMEWNKLKSVLDVGASGSRIIVTTRKQDVASVVQGVIPPYNLNVLSEAECWSIIKNKAFSPGGALETPHMKNIGEQIAKKCRGLPLAATFFGGLMHSQNDERHWLSIRDNKSLETPENHSGGIIPILKLSYDILPSHLKQCFSYCCLFPKDWEFNRETLIQLWIAEGFLHPSSGIGNQNSLEAIGNDWFLSLLSSSFFQDVVKDKLGDINTFRMHDLVHDLAQSVVGSHEITILNASEMQNDVSEIRRLQLCWEGGQVPAAVFNNVLINAKKLRTIFYQDGCFASLDPLNNKRLRVIHPLGYGNRKTLYSCFAHLRYLDLNRCEIEDVHVAFISQLYNLQTLKLAGARYASEVTDNISSLKNLRHLDLSHMSGISALPEAISKLTNLLSLDISKSNITEFPRNIHYLQNLRSLNISGTRIIQLPDSITRICNLRRLELRDCYKLTDLPSNFGALTQLRSLDLHGTKIGELPESLTSNPCKLEWVNLHHVVRVGGDYFCKIPEDIKNWVELRHLECTGETRGIEMLSRLEVLDSYSVRNEDHSSGIGELANLNSLRKLRILKLGNVRGGKIEAEGAKLKDKQNLGELGLSWRSVSKGEIETQEFVMNQVVANTCVMVIDGIQPHPNLKELEIDHFPGNKFPNWLAFCLPNLVKLNLTLCYRCDKLPALGMLPSLKFLELRGMTSIESLGEEVYYQQEEEGSATATTSFPSLIELNIEFMSILERWVTPPPPHRSFPVLEILVLNSCKVLTSVPDLRSWTSLRRLSIYSCDALKKTIPYDLKRNLTFLKHLYV